MIVGTHLCDIVRKAVLSGKYDGSDIGINNELVADIKDENEAEEVRKYLLHKSVLVEGYKNQKGRARSANLQHENAK